MVPLLFFQLNRTHMDTSFVELLVCTSCRGEQAHDDATERPGTTLMQRLQAAMPEAIRITPVACFSNCSQGCTIALRGAGRWTYVYGRLNAESDIAPLIEGAVKYAATPDGIVPWRERPEHFRKNCIARIPPIEGFSS